MSTEWTIDIQWNNNHTVSINHHVLGLDKGEAYLD
jgi:hypothetical protein